ncbi:MAG: glycosyltransferase [Actinomycetota bacterium]
MKRSRADRPSSTRTVSVQSVAVVLVVRDAARWLRDCIQGLSSQTHPRLGIVAVDNASSDGSAELLRQALGEERVIALPDNRGLPGAMKAALEHPAVREADYLLLLHDDTVLSPDAVSHMVDAAEQIENVGIVGPKVVDWDDPRVLREVGRSTDRFGFPYSPLEDGELDQGQYDRVREVLFVSSCAMLISRAAWERTGLPDERLAAHHDDLDLCWRARLAGFRVVMTPLATARHRGSSMRGERADRRAAKRGRYFAERAALASMLKNYGLVTLLWVLPLYLLQGIGKLLLFTFERRFEDVWQILSAWGWNIRRLPGTLARRRRTQSARKVPDREVRRYMAPSSVRVRRWFEAAGELVEPIVAADGDEPAAVPLRSRAASLAGSRPVFVGWTVGILVAVVAMRRLFGGTVLDGGALPVFPAHAQSFYTELLSAVRTTGLGGTQAASPGLGLLGGLSSLLFGSTSLAQKVLLGVLPFAGAVVVYRAVLRQTERTLAGVVAAACYALTPVMLWSFSQGRIPVLFALAALPILADRLEWAFGEDPPYREWRFVIGTGVVLAVGAAFFPGVALAALPLLAAQLLFARGSRVTGVRLTVLFVLAGAVLVFPMVPTFVTGAGSAFALRVGGADFASLARLVLGPAPGAWAVSWFIPASAVLSAMLAAPELRGRAFRMLVAAGASTVLAWCAAAGWLPAGFANPVAYTAAAAVAEVLLIGYGVASLLSWIGRQSFGLRQVAGLVLGTLLAGGLVLQSATAMIGSWAIGPGKLPPAWPSIASKGGGDFRVLWIGRSSGSAFPAPGGDPEGLVPAGDASLRYGVTDRQGRTALDVGRAGVGPGYDRVEHILDLALSGTTSHAGALLGPFGIRYVIAGDGDLPEGAVTALGHQLDLNLVPFGGLQIYRNAAQLPPAAVISSDAYRNAAVRADPSVLAAQPPPPATALQEVTGGWIGTGRDGGVVSIGDQFADGWRLRSNADEVAPRELYGWAVGFPMPPGAFSVFYSLQWIRTAEMILLGVLWLAALWMTRRRSDAAGAR